MSGKSITCTNGKPVFGSQLIEISQHSHMPTGHRHGDCGFSFACQAWLLGGSQASRQLLAVSNIKKYVLMERFLSTHSAKNISVQKRTI